MCLCWQGGLSPQITLHQCIKKAIADADGVLDASASASATNSSLPPPFPPPHSHLCNHVGEQCVAGNVEGHAQANVCTALIQLARQLPVAHVELGGNTTRHAAAGTAGGKEATIGVPTRYSCIKVQVYAQHSPEYPLTNTHARRYTYTHEYTHSAMLLIALYLCQQVAGWQRHVLERCWVPGCEDVAPVVGV